MKQSELRTLNSLKMNVIQFRLQLIVQVLLVIVISIAIGVFFYSLTLDAKDDQTASPAIRNIPYHSDKSLVLIHTVFRHGDRTIEREAVYKNDPYKNYSFYPENFGELTQKGRKCALNIGKLLREQYKKLLTPEFYSKIVKSYATGYSRTQMSLQCVHTGLFPPQNSKLDVGWRPIPYEILDFHEDTRLALMANCKNLKIPKIPPSDENRELIEYLRIHSGNDIQYMWDIIAITNTFQVESANGLEIPDWGKTIYPEPLETLHNQAWRPFIEANLRFGAGGLLKLITDNTLLVTNNNNIPYNTKAFLYAGHDYNLMFLLEALGVWDDKSVNFCSYLTFEIHRINGDHYVRLFYNNYESDASKAIKLPFCQGYFCSMDVFIANTKWLYDPTPVC